MILVAILALFLAGVINKGVESWYFVVDRADLMTQMPYALNRIVRELRYIKNPTSITIATSTVIAFIDIDNNSVTYNLSGTTVYRNGIPLLSGVTNFTLQYLDNNGNIISIPRVSPSPTDIRKIKVSLTTNKGNNPVNMQSMVRPRNI